MGNEKDTAASSHISNRDAGTVGESGLAFERGSVTELGVGSLADAMAGSGISGLVLHLGHGFSASLPTQDIDP